MPKRTRLGPLGTPTPVEQQRHLHLHGSPTNRGRSWIPRAEGRHPPPARLSAAGDETTAQPSRRCGIAEPFVPHRPHRPTRAKAPCPLSTRSRSTPRALEPSCWSRPRAQPAPASRGRGRQVPFSPLPPAAYPSTPCPLVTMTSIHQERRWFRFRVRFHIRWSTFVHMPKKTRPGRREPDHLAGQSFDPHPREPPSQTAWARRLEPPS
ncbi:hypothetical protein LX36DRAFT_130333 [Colletotrichum falcatum]|nr:hypothetical protein LX36DRAFT_130333 [Colletotrichum falcatum]